MTNKKDFEKKLKELEEFLSGGEYRNSNAVFYDSIDFILEEFCNLSIRERRDIRNTISNRVQEVIENYKKTQESTTA